MAKKEILMDKIYYYFVSNNSSSLDLKTEEIFPSKDELYDAFGTILTMEEHTYVDPNDLEVKKEMYYSISNKNFIDSYLSSLQLLYYIAEDEGDKTLYLGSKLYGHVYQSSYNKVVVIKVPLQGLYAIL